jgi:hypothetical protein
MYVGSCTHYLAAKGAQPSSKARYLDETYKFASGLRCNHLFFFLVTRPKFCTSTHVGKITCRNCGNSFLENVFLVPIQKLGKLLQTKESVEHSMHMYYVWREHGM